MESETLKELDKAGVELIGAVKDHGGNLLEFVEQQAPEMCGEIVLLGRVQYTAAVACGFLLLFASLGAVKYLSRWWGSNNFELQTFSQFASGFGGGAGVIIGCVIIGTNVSTCLKAWFAPRIYLLEYITDLFS